MKLKTLSALCLASATLMAANTASAWESEDGKHAVSTNVSFGSDYVFRGASQTDNKPAIQGGIDYSHASGFYVGTWASNIDFDSEASLEQNIYGGFAGEFGDSGIGFDIGVLRYIYPGEGDLNFNELYGSLSYSYFTFGVAYSGDMYNTSEDGWYYNLAFDYEFPYGINFTAAIGYSDFDRDVFGAGSPDSYKDYLIGVSKEVVGLDWALTWTDTDSDGEDLFSSKYADSRFTFSVSKSF